MLIFFRFSCVILVFILTKQSLGMTFEDLDSTELSQVQVAYQKTLYNNVGRLVLCDDSDGCIYPVGSAVYIKNAICLVEAHCIRDHENVDLAVEFEPEMENKVSYRVIKSRMHSDYKRMNTKNDIAIIKLDRCVEGIEGIDPFYDYEGGIDFVGDVENGIKSDPELLTYVGYGLSSVILLSRTVCPKTFRKVCCAYAAPEQFYEGVILSSRNRMRDVTRVEHIKRNKRLWRPRKAIDLEVMVAMGMSGGATFDGADRFVGLISGVRASNSYKNSLINSVRFLNTVIINLRLCLPVPFIPYPYSYEQGAVIKSTSLKFHKDWIEQNVSEFMMDDEPLQERTVQAQEVPSINKLGTFKEWGEKIMRGDVYAIVTMVLCTSCIVSVLSLVRDICAVFK